MEVMESFLISGKMSMSFFFISIVANWCRLGAGIRDHCNHVYGVEVAVMANAGSKRVDAVNTNAVPDSH